MKKLLLLCLVFAAHITSAATDRLLVVWTTGGEKVSFALSANPQITFSNQTLCIKTDSQSQNFEIAQVAQYYFEDNATAIAKPQFGELRISQTGNEQITVEGLQPSAAVRLYAVDGREMPDRITRSEGSIVISLLSLPKGVYFISTDNKQNLKIYKR